jgi:hypothetical protein
VLIYHLWTPLLSLTITLITMAGYLHYLELNQNANIYLRTAPDGESYLRAFLFFKRYIGLDQSLLEANPDRFVYVDEKVEIFPDVFIIPKIEFSYPKPKGNKYLYLHLRKTTERQLEDFSHELVLTSKKKMGSSSFPGVLTMVYSILSAQ